ncbi:SLC13 family permease [Bacillus tianshenii]|nr:SLC13 family permease [Bacillus tianshenii]
MNAVIVAVLVMLILSLFRVNVVLALVTGAIIGGLTGELSMSATIEAFTSGLGGSAEVALSYALLGGFAVAIARTGLPELLVNFALRLVGKEGESKKKAMAKVLLVLVILTISIFSQNVIPVHIAFIPILIPPLLKVFNELGIDRRLIATVITFGLTAPYILLPAGFGLIFHEILQTNMAESGLEIEMGMIPKAMLLPTLGMVVGLLVAIFFSYRTKSAYDDVELVVEEKEKEEISSIAVGFALVAVVAALVFQTISESMIIGALAGIITIYLGFFFNKNVKWKETDTMLTEGMQMMAFIGFVMIAASGFASVLRETGHVEMLVDQAAGMIGDNKSLAAFLMLVVGLLVTMGIGSSFSTIPIIATIFVPLALQLGFSPLATTALVGAAAALGDAGSPASDSTLGPTAGLNADGQHNHIWDTCVPTFLHYNIPLVLFGWLAAIML